MNTRIGDELTCLVCSDRAMGNNFGAISCESCKAFFRRNAHDIERLRCEFSGKCSITILTRRHCRRCRLEKCFLVGMRKDWILTEEQLQVRRARIQSRKCREMATRSSNLPSSLSSSSATAITTSPPTTNYVTSSSSSSSPSSNHCLILTQVQHHHSSMPFYHDPSNSIPFDFVNAVTTTHRVDVKKEEGEGSDESNDDDDEKKKEEEEDEYEELCDKMGQKIFDINLSHNILTSLLDDNLSDHHQHLPQTQLQNIYPSSSLTISSPVDSINQFYPGFHQISQSSSPFPSPMASNVPNSFLCPSPSNQTIVQLDHQPYISPSPSSSTITPLPSSLGPFSSSSQFSFNSSQGSSSTSDPLFTQLPIKSEPVETETVNGQTYDLIIGSDLSLPIDLSGEYITSDFQLAQLINQRMDELMNLHSLSFEPVPMDSQTTLQETAIRLIEYTAQLLIGSFKNLTSFNRLPLQVRNDLFKGSFPDLITIRSCFHFDLDKGGWPVPGVSELIKLNLVKKFDSQPADRYLDFIKDLHERWQRDIKIGLVLEAVALFNPELADMKHQETIRKEKHIYTYLLRRYLESTGLSEAQARTDCYDILIKFEMLKMNIDPLDKIRKICFYQATKAGQLLSEILDLS